MLILILLAKKVIAHRVSGRTLGSPFDSRSEHGLPSCRPVVCFIHHRTTEQGYMKRIQGDDPKSSLLGSNTFHSCTNKANTTRLFYFYVSQCNARNWTKHSVFSAEVIRQDHLQRLFVFSFNSLFYIPPLEARRSVEVRSLFFAQLCTV